ncbi:hypothetical protein HY485_02115 [Candidatus Woesearchaeota archaeon]|nr:hypothetical protein [Candidatus Woesearchaeota archaeon]
MIEYTLERYLTEQRFVEAVEKSGVDVQAYSTDHETLHKKRGLVKIRYRNLKVEGGIRLPVDECKAARVCEALRDMYCIAKRYVADFPQVRPVIARTNELLSLEECALKDAAKMPLFAQASVNKARADTQAYFVSLTPEQRTFVKKCFGERVKPYLSGSGRVKAATQN